MSCHSGADAKPSNDQINFDTYETALVKRFVPLLIKGRPETSRLYIVVDNSEMPIDGSLSQKEIDFIGQWIEICAPKYEPEQLPDECQADDNPDDDWGDDDWFN